MVDIIFHYIKEYELLSIVAIVISLMAYFRAKRVDKANREREIAKKKAELGVIKSTRNYIDLTTMNNNMIRQSVLEREIEELEKKN